MDKSTVSEEKKSARKIYRRMRSELSSNDRRYLDLALLTHITNNTAFISADTVLCYYSVKGEPDVLPIAKYALNLGKKVAFPISHIEDRMLTFHIVTSLSELTEGAYGIPEPNVKAPAPTVSKNTVCIVPALAFDKNGKRLGYGGGYYDRFLSTFDGVAIGLAYNCFIAQELPTDEYDATMDIIITEKGEIF